MQIQQWQSAVNGGTAVLFLILVLVPAVGLAIRRLPSRQEWNKLRAEITGVHRDLLDEYPDYSNETRQALRLVLARTEGFGRIRNIPLALDVLATPHDTVARGLRALAGQAVVIGLAGTVATFCLMFSRPEFGSSAVNNFVLVREHLRSIYIINAACLVSSIVLIAVAKVKRDGSDRLLAAASDALSRLEEGGDDVIGPELAGALQRSSEQFRRFSEELVTTQFARIEALLGEIRLLGESIGQVVREVTDHSGTEHQRVLDSVIQAQQAQTEAFVERFDAGFKLLAQPFIQGIPAMQALSESADALKTVGADVVQANIGQSVQQMRLAVNQLERTAASLSAAVGISTRKAGEAVQSALASALEGPLAELRKVSAFFSNDCERLITSAEATASRLATDRAGAHEKVIKEVSGSIAQLVSAIEPFAKGVHMAEEMTSRLLTELSERLRSMEETREAATPAELSAADVVVNVSPSVDQQSSYQV